MQSLQAGSAVWFGPFKLDLKAGELYTGARRIRLQEQPFQILRTLVECPGEVVTREQLQKKLWPNDTVVEFDHSINAAVRRLRDALGDAAEKPKYVETVARRGYRLLVAVHWEEAHPADEAAAAPEVDHVLAESAPTNLTGKKVSHYRVLDVLGGGGMGVVYKAEDIKLGRRVALKFLPEELASDRAALERFEREARAASVLNHPHICTVYELGEHAGQPFIAMELLEGQTLRQRIGVGAGLAPPAGPQVAVLSVDQMLTIAMQITDGLEAAHGKGIVHRDIKPANIFVTDRGEAKILDFGIATLQEPCAGAEIATPTVPAGLSRPMEAGELKATLPDAPLATLGGMHLTRTGVALGTASYMSPEQVRGEQLDARTDLFSFGLVLYEMATGRQAFYGTTRAVIYEAILNRAPLPITSVNRELPPELEDVINKALEKDRDSRYQHASEIRADLKRLKPNLESAQRVGAIRQFILRWPRRRTPSLVIAALALAALAAMLALNLSGFRDHLVNAVVVSHPISLPKIDSIAVLPLENLSRDPDQDYFADGMTDELIATLAKIGTLRVISRTSVMRFKGTRKPLPEIARELNVDAVIEGSVLRVGNRVRITAELIQGPTDRHLWAETYDRDLRDVLDLQNEVARAIQSKIQITVKPLERARLATPRPVDPDAHDAYIKGRSSLRRSNTGDEVRTAIKYFESAIGLDPTYAAPYAGLADAYSTQGFSYYLPPREAYPRAKAAAAKALTLDENSAEAYASLCWINVRFDWDWQAAERNCTRAVELDTNSGNAAGPASDYYFLTGRPGEALVLLRRSVARDPLAAGAHHSLGWGYFMSRRYDEAIPALQQALALDPMDSGTWEDLGHTYVEKKMYPEALKAYGRAAALLNGSDAGYRAYVYGRAGERDKALKALEEFKQASKGGHMPPGAFAFIYLGIGDKDEAFQLLEKAFEERDTAWFPLIKVSPMSDSLRSDPRFQDLLRRLNFPP